MARKLVAALIAACVLVAGRSGGAETLDARRTAQAKEAFAAAVDGRWERAHRLAREVGDETFAQIVRWLDNVSPGTDASFADITAFIAAHPIWPMMDRLRLRAEEAITPALPDNVLLGWFQTHPPLSAEGLASYGMALIRRGDQVHGSEAIRRAWIEGNFGQRQEREFYQHYRPYLGRQVHRERIERLIWDDRYSQAQRMLGRIGPDDRLLAEARLVLMRDAGNVDRAIARVPEGLRNDAGLVYERLRWRRRKGRDDAARDLLVQPPIAPLVRPDKWWAERSVLARRALQEGSISEAYRMATNHGLKAGEDFAEAEWLAGWIALRWLGEARQALGHFVPMYQGVRTPVSLARAAYWAGRAAESLGDAEAARAWFKGAARHAATYYGQLALARLAPDQDAPLPTSPDPGDAEREEFARHELTRAVRILGEIKTDEWLRPFVLALAAADARPGWRVLTAELAQALGRPDLAVAVAKVAHRERLEVIPAGYPTDVPLPRKRATRDGGLETALVLAVIRQESAFAAAAVSPAGARGLMQLLPRTARTVAAGINIDYKHDRLTTDPDLNVVLGQAYLESLIADFDGSYLLALAAYNAGPSRVRAWIRANGDPREAGVDPTDWIEMIPFSETRNYLQRVMENLQVYRARFRQIEVAQGRERGSGR